MAPSTPSTTPPSTPSDANVPGTAHATPASPSANPYPVECGSFDPFPPGEVWGLPQGWAADPFRDSLAGARPVMRSRRGGGLLAGGVRLRRRYLLLRGPVQQFPGGL